MAARPIWNGTLSFGLLNIPIQLMTGEKRTELHFRMMDARNKAPVKYERVNAETGEEVPWKEIVKAYEYDKGSYVVLEPEDIKSAAPESHAAIERRREIAVLDPVELRVVQRQRAVGKEWIRQLGTGLHRWVGAHGGLGVGGRGVDGRGGGQSNGQRQGKRVLHRNDSLKGERAA